MSLLRDWAERARVEGWPSDWSCRQIPLQPRNFVLEFGYTDRQTFSPPFVCGTTFASPVVTHVGGSIPAHGYVTSSSVTASVTTGYVTR
jgi:hypothetical protein